MCIKEDLTEAERIKVLLGKKDPLQQGYVFINAINIFKDDPAMQRDVIPLILSKLSSCSEQVMADAGLKFFELIRHKVSHPSLTPLDPARRVRLKSLRSRGNHAQPVEQEHSRSLDWRLRLTSPHPLKKGPQVA